MQFLNILLPLTYLAFFLWLIGKLNYFKTAGFSALSLQFTFLIKAFCGLVIYLIYTYYYPVRMEADTFKYFDDSKYLYNALWEHPLDYFKMLFGINCENDYFLKQYYSDMYNWYRSYDNGLLNDNRLVIRLNAFVRLFSFGNYHVHSLFFNFLTFIGSYSLARLFLVFSESKWKTYLIVFLIPSFVFWSAGILKESILIFALGSFTWNVYKLISGSHKISTYLWILFLIPILFIMKFYVFVALIPAILAWWISQKTKRTISIHLVTIVACLLVALGIGTIFPTYNFLVIMAAKQGDFINLANFLNVNSSIYMDYLEPNLWSFIKASPKAFINTLTRPWPTELKGILFYPPLFENLFIIFILFIGWFYRKKVNPKQWKFIIFCLTFSILLFVIIGLTTPIIGAIVRYKIPAIPFLIFVALLFLDDSKLPQKLRSNKFILWLHSHL
jgi:hypothetical protein